jgi:hypothetical protein
MIGRHKLIYTYKFKRPLTGCLLFYHIVKIKNALPFWKSFVNSLRRVQLIGAPSSVSKEPIDAVNVT